MLCIPGAEDTSRRRPLRLNPGFLSLEQAFRPAPFLAETFLLRYFLLESRHPANKNTKT